MPKPPRLDSPDDERVLVRYYAAGLFFMAVLIAAFPVYRAGEPERRAAAREAVREQNVSLGRDLYALHCRGCHGEAGRGGGTGPTLAAEEFLTEVSNEQLRWLTAAGIPGTAMPAYDIDHGGPLTMQDIERLVVYLRSLEEDAPSVPGWREGALAPNPQKARDQVTATSTSASEPAHSSPSSTTPAPTEAESATATLAEAESDPSAPTEAESATATLAEAESSTGTGAGAPSELTPDARQLAERTYKTYCVPCHGPTGGGTPIGSRIRPPKPPLDRDLPALVDVIAKGVPSTAMVGFGPDSDFGLETETLRALARWLQDADRQ